VAYLAPNFLFELEQQGSTLKGSVRLSPGGHAELDGAAAGNVFRFRALGPMAI